MDSGQQPFPQPFHASWPINTLAMIGGALPGGPGYHTGSVDGIVGSGITNAVKTCQRKNGLVVNGLITASLISDMLARM